METSTDTRARREAPYANIIREFTDADPRLVEASMRVQYGTLDHLSRDVFRAEAELAEAMIAHDPDAMERVARSYGL